MGGQASTRREWKAVLDWAKPHFKSAYRGQPSQAAESLAALRVEEQQWGAVGCYSQRVVGSLSSNDATRCSTCRRGGVAAGLGLR
jgi:hypothetical protein